MLKRYLETAIVFFTAILLLLMAYNYNSSTYAAGDPSTTRLKVPVSVQREIEKLVLERASDRVCSSNKYFKFALVEVEPLSKRHLAKNCNYRIYSCKGGAKLELAGTFAKTCIPEMQEFETGDQAR